MMISAHGFHKTKPLPSIATTQPSTGVDVFGVFSSRKNLEPHYLGQPQRAALLDIRQLDPIYIRLRARSRLAAEVCWQLVAKVKPSWLDLKRKATGMLFAHDQNFIWVKVAGNCADNWFLDRTSWKLRGKRQALVLKYYAPAIYRRAFP
eukprot:6208868-Pleurochrysis_carterae.AAC.2